MQFIPDDNAQNKQTSRNMYEWCQNVQIHTHTLFDTTLTNWIWLIIWYLIWAIIEENPNWMKWEGNEYLKIRSILNDKMSHLEIILILIVFYWSILYNIQSPKKIQSKYGGRIKISLFCNSFLLLFEFNEISFKFLFCCRYIHKTHSGTLSVWGNNERVENRKNFQLLSNIFFSTSLCCNSTLCLPWIGLKFSFNCLNKHWPYRTNPTHNNTHRLLLAASWAWVPIILFALYR